MIRRFRGEAVNKIDQKGRVSVPASFRRTLEEGDPDWVPGGQPNMVLIWGGPGGKCLVGYTILGAAALDEKISRLPTFSKQRKALERWFSSQSVYAQVDDTGRFVLSAKLREMIGIESEVMFAGMGDKFEIWEPGAYAADMADLEDWREGLEEDEDPFAALDRMDAGL